MRDTTLRWGMGMGVLAAAIGTGALVVGAFIEPIKRVTTADAIALALFVRGMLVLISLGIALGLAYYAGMRVARAYFLSLNAATDSPETATTTAIASLVGVPVNRRYTALAGGLTMFCYWLITSMYIFVLPPTDQASAPQANILSFLETRLLFGVIYVVFGLGLGGLGGRAPAARLLLERIALSKPALASTPLAAPASSSAAALEGSAMGPEEASSSPAESEPSAIASVPVEPGTSSVLDTVGTQGSSTTADASADRRL